METLSINSWIRSNEGLLCTAIITALLTVWNQANAKTNTITSDTIHSIEQALSKDDIVSNILQRTWVSLPSWYEEKTRNLINQCALLEDDDIAKFTEDFIVKHINENPWINEENRNLFVINLCLEYLLDKDVYEWDDWNEERTQEFKIVLPILRDTLEKYINDITQKIVTLIYMKQNDLEDFHSNNTRNINQKGDKTEESLNRLISFCNQLGINYKKRLSSLQWLYDL